MAVKRALVYRTGNGVGDACGAYQVAIERGRRGREGTMTNLGRCANLPTVLLNGTGLCAYCADAIQRSSSVGVVQSIQRPRTN